jgi:hypothetical protein
MLFFKATFFEEKFGKKKIGKMEVQGKKTAAFVRHLLNNPALRNQTPLQKEEQIIAFLDMNSAQLFPTLSSSAFFPGYSWQQIRALLVQELLKTTDEAMQAYLQRIIFEQLDLAFTAFLGLQKVPQEEMKTRLLNLLGEISRKAAGRSALMGSFNALAFKLPDKYIETIFDSRNYIRFELEKVQRLRMSKEEVKNLVRTSLLIRPSVYLLSPDGAGAVQYKIRGTVPTHAADMVAEKLQEKLPNYPWQVIRSGVDSNLSFLENSGLLTTARLTTLFSHMAREYKPDMIVDRGAASPEKSWFSVARRNYRYFGYDIKMVDELYRIAAENGW